MRITRVEKFKRYRHQKTRRLIFYTIVLPTAWIFLGYIIASLIILPAMAK